MSILSSIQLFPRRSHRAMRTFGSIAALVSLLGFSAPVSAQIGSAEPAVDAALNDIIEDYMAAEGIPGLTIAASKNGKMVMNRGYGVTNVNTQFPMQPHHRTRMGSLAKMLLAMNFMKYSEDTQDPGLLDRKIYGFNGILSVTDYPDFYSARNIGWQRQTPVVATVISKANDHVYTYYDNGKYSIGTTSDLDAYSGGLLDYFPPAGQQPRDIAGMAAATTGHVYTWYFDGRASIGSFSDLDANFYTTADVELPEDQSMRFLVGIGISGTTNKVYSWWEDGTRSVGHYADLGFYADQESKPYSDAPGQTTYTIRSMAISKSDKIYTFYNDETVTSGTSLNLDAHKSAYATSLPNGISAEPWSTWYSTMTPRHALSHSAGYARDISLTGATVMATPGHRVTDGFDGHLGMELFHEYGLVSGRPLFAPGTDASYSNHGAAVTGFLLEDLSGMPYKTLLDTTILNPMNISMGFVWDPLGWNDATPHWDNNEGVGVPDVVTCSCDVGFRFHEQTGYLTSNAGDYLRVMMTMDLASDPLRRMLDDATIASMEAPGPGGDYGIGWRIVDADGWLDHGGSLRGGGAAVLRFKDGYEIDNRTTMDDITVVVMGNLNVSMRPLALEIAKAVNRASVDPNYDLY